MKNCYDLLKDESNFYKNKVVESEKDHIALINDMTNKPLNIYEKGFLGVCYLYL